LKELAFCANASFARKTKDKGGEFLQTSKHLLTRPVPGLVNTKTTGMNSNHFAEPEI